MLGNRQIKTLHPVGPFKGFFAAQPGSLVPCICILERSSAEVQLASFKTRLGAQYCNIYRGDILMARRRWSSVTFSDPSNRQLSGGRRAVIGVERRPRGNCRT